jgi:hypothetical protein
MEGVLQIFIAIKNPLPSAGIEPANIGSYHKHASPYTTEDDYVSRILGLQILLRDFRKLEMNIVRLEDIPSLFFLTPYLPQ